MLFLLDYFMYMLFLTINKIKTLQKRDLIAYVIFLLPVYFVFLIPSHTLQILTVGFLLYFGTSYYYKSFVKGFNLTLIYLFTSIISLVAIHGMDPTEYFHKEVFTFYNIIRFLIIKFTLGAPILFLMNQNEFTSDRFKTLINRTSYSIFLSVLLIYILKDINVFGYLGIDSHIYFDFLYSFPIIIYIFEYAYLYHLYFRMKQMDQYQALKSSLQEDIETVLKAEQSKMILNIQKLLESDDIKAIESYTKAILEETYLESQNEKIQGIEDQNLIMMIQSKQTQFPEIVFDIIVKDFSLSDITQEEPYFLEMFGIVFDNAIEGALRSEEKLVRVTFTDTKVVIENTYQEEDLNNYYLKQSSTGNKQRVNGLKLLKYLNQKSEVIIISNVSDMISYEMQVIV